MHDSTTVETDGSIAVHDVTSQVEDCVPSSADGVCVVSVRHTTAAIVLNEAETGLLDDIESMVRSIVPDGPYEHDRIDDNAEAHLVSVLLGESAVVPLVDGDLALGTWQSVLLIEADGPRRRTIDVTVLGGAAD
ncbi:MAG: secondary thiamine-phosphate synthase enzyme YjbQ [Halanaeroarchaeum sp.]